MSHKSSVIHLRLIQITLIFLFIEISKTQPTSPWNDEEKENRDLEDSITSGIRKLEKIRREIIESSLKGLENNQDSPSMDNSRLSGEANGSKGQNSLAFKATEVRHPRRQVDLAMYEALSKLANIQIADPGIRDSTRSRSSQYESTGRLTSGPKFYDSVDEDRSKDAYTNFGISRTIKNDGTTEKTATTFSKLQFVPRKFQCHPIREIYIPKVDKKMPAYACSLGKRAFVISSERFIQDSRDHFEVNVDESTFRRLTPMNSGMTTLTSGVSVLPATLVLKQGEDGYTVRGVNANWKEVQTTATRDN